ncbi:MAG: DNA polymerase I [Candidatus Magasanikbacteria bacterium]
MDKKNYKNRLVLIDGHAIVHRAYYALPPMTTKDGTMVNAVYGFTTMLLKVLEDLEPTHMALGVDVKGKTFRDEMYEQYKEHREEKDQELYDQIPMTHKIAEAFDIPVYKKQGFEADDILGTVAKHIDELDGEDTEVIIVTGDKDMLQLVDERTRIALIKKGITNLKVYDRDEVVAEYGFAPEKMIDYKALKGDSSDNIPGISGIGDKRAKDLIDTIGGVDEVLDQIDKQDSKLYKEFTENIISKIKDGTEDAQISKKLATIRTDVEETNFDLDKCKLDEFDQQKIRDTFKKFEFFSLLKRIPGAENFDTSKKKDDFLKNLKDITRITTSSDLKQLKKKIDKNGSFACKEVLNSESVINSRVEGFVCLVDNQPFYIDINEINSKEKVLDLFGKDIEVVGHDLKRLAKTVLDQGKPFSSKLFDIKVASYLINSSADSHSLEEIILRELEIEAEEEDNQDTLFGEDPKLIAENLYFSLKIKEEFSEKLDEVDTENLFEEVEMKLIPILAKMELNGIAIDRDKFDDLSQQVKEKIKQLEEKIHEHAGEKFNVNSTKQLREVLYDKLELPTENIKEGKTGYSTAASELEKLRGEHPIVELIEEHRELEKLRNTYIDVLPTLVNEKTGRIHTSFNQTVTATGRLSSSDPNLQNIPIRSDLGKEIRKAFVAEKGGKLLAADYSQIELRIVAHLSGDEKLIDIFSKNQDVHTATAAEIHEVEPDEVTADMRSKAKEVNYGVLYGMGPHGMAQRTDIDRAEAKKFIERYFEKFSGVERFVDKSIEYAKEKGYAETMFGRRRYLPELESDNYHLRRSGERMAINMPVQGTQADLIKMAMIEIDQHIEDKFKGDLKMLLQVHDELVFEINKDEIDLAKNMIVEQMEDIIDLVVPVEVDVAVGDRWGELK